MTNKKAPGVQDNPFHEHDCDACVFLGKYDGASKVDLYYCPAHEEFVARYGQMGEYYSAQKKFLKQIMGSTNYGYAIGHMYINQAVDKAIELGLVKEFRI